MSGPAPPRMTAAQFVAWAMRQPDGERFELVAGEVVPLAPERVAHALTKFAVARALAEAVQRARVPCTVYPDGMAVAIDGDTIYEPDALLRSGPEPAGGADLIADPLIVAEVRSPAAGSRDSGVKLVDYFRIPSLRHYLIVVEQTRTVVHHFRGDDGRIITSVVRDAPVPLDPPGILLDIAWPGSP